MLFPDFLPIKNLRLEWCLYLMLNKPLNVAHTKDRQAQRCIKKGLFDSAVNLERNIIENLEVSIEQ